MDAYTFPPVFENPPPKIPPLALSGPVHEVAPVLLRVVKVALLASTIEALSPPNTDTELTFKFEVIVTAPPRVDVPETNKVPTTDAVLVIKLELIVTAPLKIDDPDTDSAPCTEALFAVRLEVIVVTPETDKAPKTDAVLVVRFELIVTAPLSVEIPDTVRAASTDVPSTEREP